MLINILWEAYASVIEVYPEPEVTRAFFNAEKALLNDDDLTPMLLLLWGYAPHMAEEVTASW